MTSALDKIPSRELIIACIEDHPKAITMLRLARRRALDKSCGWRAVFIETPAQFKGHDADTHARMLRWLTLAEQMGGQSLHIEAESIEKGLSQLFQKEGANIIRLIIGSVETERRFGFLRNWPRWRLIRMLERHALVEVVPLPGITSRLNVLQSMKFKRLKPQFVFYALLSVVIAYLGALTLKWALPHALFRINDQNVGLLFMIACAFVAGRFGMIPGLIAAVTSFFTINYYFTLPYQVLKLDSITDILNMALFLSAAMLISLFASQTRDFARKAARRETITEALYTLYRVASESFSRDQAVAQLQEKLEHMLEADVAFFMPNSPRKNRVDPIFPKNLALNDNDRKALDTCWNDMKTTGAASPFNPGTEWRFEPMISPQGEVGVLAVRPRRGAQMDVWFGKLLTAIADQTATALEHIDLERSMEETRIREEREQLRSMLLSSVTHDFKTPLAGIIGALSVYRSIGDRLSQDKRAELLDAAMEEAQRLDSFITNILDMTRLESGNIRFRKEWHDAKTMIHNVGKRLSHRLRQHELVIHNCPPNIEVNMDVMMTEQVLQNIIDNACKYTPAGTKIDVSCTVDNKQGFVCAVRDHGAGLPEEKLDRVFDKYARLHKKDSQVAGTGLGLAISKAVMEAQGGWIVAANHPNGGAIFTFCLPEWRKVQSLKEVGGGV